MSSAFLSVFPSPIAYLLSPSVQLFSCLAHSRTLFTPPTATDTDVSSPTDHSSGFLGSNTTASAGRTHQRWPLRRRTCMGCSLGKFSVLFSSILFSFCFLSFSGHHRVPWFQKGRQARAAHITGGRCVHGMFAGYVFCFCFVYLYFFFFSSHYSLDFGSEDGCRVSETRHR